MVAKKLGMQQDSFPSDLGASNYNTELSPNHDGVNTSWPRRIASGCVSPEKHPTPAVHNNLIFSDVPAVVVVEITTDACSPPPQKRHCSADRLCLTSVRTSSEGVST
jgi:hypothetical protein